MKNLNQQQKKTIQNKRGRREKFLVKQRIRIKLKSNKRYKYNDYTLLQYLTLSLSLHKLTVNYEQSYINQTKSFSF